MSARLLSRACLAVGAAALVVGIIGFADRWIDAGTFIGMALVAAMTALNAGWQERRAVACD